MKGKKIVVFIGFLAACNIGSQSVTKQERPIAGFNAIILDGVGNMYIHPGENHKVAITTNSNLLERVVTTVNKCKQNRRWENRAAIAAGQPALNTGFSLGTQGIAFPKNAV